MTAWLLSLGFAWTLQGSSALDEVRKQPDPLRRFEAALTLAGDAMRRARTVVQEAGTITELKAALDEVSGGVEVALEALRATGKHPRRLSKQYKKGEVRSRDLLRQLEQLVPAISLDSRPPAEQARDRVAELHEQFLRGAMGHQ